VPSTGPQPSPQRPIALVVAEGALERHRLQRRLTRGGLLVPRCVDPWLAEGEIAHGGYDVVLWAGGRTEALARGVLLPGGRPAEGGPRAVLLADAWADGSRLAAALAAGFDDVLRAGAPGAELVARVRAAALRGREIRELAAAAEAFRGLAEGSRDLLARHSPDGTVLYASPAARQILGHEPGALVGRSAAELWHPDEAELVRRLHAGGAPGPGPHLHRLRRRDGRWAWMETSAHAVRDPAGRVREVRTDSRDVTERVRAEAERAALARLTAAVAGGMELPRFLGRAAEEAAALVGAPTAAVVRLHGDEGVVLGAAGGALRPGDPVPLAPRDGRTVSAPVTVQRRAWGILMARGSHAGALRRGDEERLIRVAGLVSLGIANAEARERLLALATTDPLTGLVNHRVFHERLGAEIARSRRAGVPLSLVMIDLDRFKRVNDTHGHQVGDEVLREVARRLADGARREDVVARVGGEELAWLLPEAGLEAAMVAAERLRRRVGDEGFPVVGRLTASLGVASLGAQDTAADLVGRADRALYLAKEGGRDACVAETALPEAALPELSLNPVTIVDAGRAGAEPGGVSGAPAG